MAALSEAELVDAIRELEDLKCRAAAQQARLARDLAAARGRDAAALVAHARRESPARGTRLVGLATALAELAHTEAAMDAGVLSEWRATIIARETACLSREDRAAVDHRIAAPDAAGRRPLDGWGDRRLAAEVRALVAQLDPQAVVDRHARAEADRRVTLRPAPDTMAQLTSLLPVAQGVAVWATLSRAADEARAAGDPRSRGQVMADTLVERVTGQSRADAVPITVDLVVSDRSLLAGGHEPAWLQGYGAIAADHADELVQQAVTDARAALRRLYAAPTGGLVAMESRSREFPEGLARFLELRDRTCRTPWCDAPIRHRDHVVAHAFAGSTSEPNGQGLCEQCNYVKQAPGWRARPITGPPGHPHQVEITLPTGHVVRSTAPPAPKPSGLHPAHRLEWVLERIVLAA